MTESASTPETQRAPLATGPGPRPYAVEPPPRSAVHAWLRTPAVSIFLWSRAAIWLGVLFAAMWFEPKPPPVAAIADNERLHDVGHVVDVWARWDSSWLLTIAEDGYTANLDSTAFYPLYPALVRVVGLALGGHYLLAGVLISLAAALGAFVLLYRLAEARLGPAGARRTVLYLAIFPTTLFLQAVYTESLFLLLVLAAFLLAERGRFLGASAAIGFAMLTRAIGFAALPALAYYAWRAPDRRRALASLALAPAMVLAYPLYLWLRIGDPLEFLDAQERHWGRRTTFLGPLEGLWGAVTRGVPSIFDLFDADPVNVRVVQGLDPWDSSAVNLQALLFLGLFVALTYVAYKRLPRPDFLYAGTSLLFLLASPSYKEWPLVGLPRYGLVIFPFFLALAILGARPNVHNAIVGVSAILLGVAVTQWALFQWVG